MAKPATLRNCSKEQQFQGFKMDTRTFRQSVYSGVPVTDDYIIMLLM